MRKRLSVAAVAACAGALLAVPGVEAATTQPAAASPSGRCEADAQPGGTLTAARQNETLSLSPYFTPGGYGDGEAISLIYQPLVMLDPTGATQDIVPGVAESWEVSEDGLTYTFRLRQGNVFSNGDPVTAADVKFSLDTWADPEQNAFADFAAGYRSVTIVDDATVEVNLSEPRGAFLYSLAMVTASILPEALVTEQGDAFFENPVGSGPFVLDEWNKGSSISFARNDNYWEAGAPLLDGVVWNFVTDDNARVLQLKSGDAQQIDSIPWSEVAGLMDADGIVVDSLEIPSWVLMSLNHQKPQFQDRNVRQALSLAIDRELVNERIYSGLGTLPNSILPALRFDASAEELAPTPFDLAAAQQLIAESGFPDGFEVRVEYPATSAAFETLAIFLQAQWAELGIEVSLHPEDQGTLSTSLREGTYDIILPYALAVSDVVVPDEFAAFYAVPGGTNGFFSWWEDAEIAAQVTEFLHTTDDAVRAEQWPVIQAAMLAEQPVINVMNLPFLKGRQDNVCDTTASAIGYDTYLYAWIAE